MGRVGGTEGSVAEPADPSAVSMATVGWFLGSLAGVAGLDISISSRSNCLFDCIRFPPPTQPRTRLGFLGRARYDTKTRQVHTEGRWCTRSASARPALAERVHHL